MRARAISPVEMLRCRAVAVMLFLALPPFSEVVAQSIALDKEDATVWGQEQLISGVIEGATSGVLYTGTEAVPFDAPDGHFTIPVVLGNGENSYFACAGQDEAVCTDPLVLTLGFELRPTTELVAMVEGGTVLLTGTVLDNPSNDDLTFDWEIDASNPAPASLDVQGDGLALLTIPAGSPAGEYYVNWTVTSGEARPRRARTFVRVDSEGGVSAFDLENEHAEWIERATFYGIAPFYFVRFAPNRLQAVRQKLSELASLGVNTLWLQPIHPTHGAGQSYDVTDFFSVWSGFGTEQNLRDLIDEAHSLGMRVLLDLVPNHTALQHPFAQDAIAHGERSHYFDYYQRQFDSAPYARHYNSRSIGQMTFVYYFWNELVNLNYNNPEVRRHMIEASLYWVENFDVDGYRVDVAWGPDARTPEFFQEWRRALKRVKPEVFLLGEDKATRPHVFERRFDAAYDWAAGESWVSEWMWATSYSSNSNPTIFNDGSDLTRSARLRSALNNGSQGWAPNARVVRFMENNDTFRFVSTHSLAQTRMVAALLYSLPGNPLMYNGQEVGFPNHPYSTGTIFGGGTIRSQDNLGLFSYYQYLLRLREALPALHSSNYRELVVNPISVRSRTFGYHRWEGEQHVVVALNMGAAQSNASLALNLDDMGLDAEAEYHVTNLLTREATLTLGADLATFAVPLPGHTTVLYAITNEPLDLPVSTDPGTPPAGEVLALEQNYPNPFSGQSVLAFETVESGHVRLSVYDMLGRRVAELIDQDLPSGRHDIAFDGSSLASGVYLYVLESAGTRLSRRMTVVR
ncbi:hypothetical protein BH23BAC4_BH23BAC4_00680 [soil metagenome]